MATKKKKDTRKKRTPINFIGKQRQKTGVSNGCPLFFAAAVIRNDIFRPNPEADYIFTNGDPVAVMGNTDDRETFLKHVMP